jgi:ankyrin repeat protein
MFDRSFLVCSMAILVTIASIPVRGADPLLVDAVKNKNRDAIRSLLKQRVDVNAPEPDGTTALDWAVHWDDVETAKALIAAGANVNAATEYGVTPIFLACTNANAGLVEALLKAGANPNAVLKRTSETPLMRCSRSGNPIAVKSLLDHGANVNARETWRNQAALMWACEANHPEAAKMLIEHGADVHARSAGGFTPLLFAARTGNVDLAALLLASGASVDESTPEDGPVLVVASASGNEELGKFLLEKGANPNVADGYGVTPLHFALRKGLFNLSAAEFTFSFAAPPNLTGLATALLSHGANPNLKITKDYPAHTRAPFRQTPSPSIVGATPFFLAAASGDVKLMQALIASGADTKLLVKDGTTPLMAASGINRVQDFADGDDKNAFEAVKLLLEIGSDVNAVNDRGLTALHAAALMGVDSVVEALVTKGANTNAKDLFGQTPWTIAEAMSPVVNNQGSLRMHKSTADLLLKLGAKEVSIDELRASEAVYGKYKKVKRSGGESPSE